MHRFRPRTALFATLAIVASACSIGPQSNPETTATPAAGSPAVDLVLFTDGIGPFTFGDRADIVIDGLTATVGGWDADSAEADVVAPPACLDGPGRLVSWGSLVLTFVTRDGTEIFAGWAYGFDPLTANSDDPRKLGLETSQGVGLGSTRSDLAATFGIGLSVIDDTTIDTATFVVGTQEQTQLAGKLDAAGPSGRVDFLETTPGC